VGVGILNEDGIEESVVNGKLNNQQTVKEVNVIKTLM